MTTSREIFADNSSSPGGYVYVPRDDPRAMAEAKPGACIGIPGRAPPWIVVDHDLATVIVARWPGCLWRVEIVDPITPHDVASAGAGNLRADAGYTRAAAVKVLEKVPVAALFGAHGVEVCAVIDAASELTLDAASRLARTRHAQAGEAQTRIWRAWLARQHPQLAANAGSHDGTLGIVARPASPIGRALSVISGQVGKRAETVAGKSVWRDDPGDPEEVCLAEPWASAQLPLLDAALAVGAPEFASEPDRLILLEAWRAVFG